MRHVKWPFNFKAVLLGWLIGYWGQAVVGCGVMLAFFITDALLHGSMDTKRWEALGHNLPFLCVALLLETVFMLLAGFIAACFTGDKPRQNALWVGIWSLVTDLGLNLALDSFGQSPLWYSIVSYLLLLPLTLLGGHWWAVTQKPDGAQHSEAAPPIPKPF